MINVLIADNSAPVRQGLKRILDEDVDMRVLGEARNAQEVFEVAAKAECDIVLLDIDIPGKNCFDVLKELKAERPSLPVVVMSIHPEKQFAVRALEDGARGYLTKERAPEELAIAIRKVFDGERYISGPLSKKLNRETGPASGKKP